MKITRLQIDGILGISSIDIKPTTAVQLFCGANGSGKSSIRDSVALAIAQQSARGVTLKKEYAALVRDGADQGGALITMNNDNDQTFSFNMPGGKFAGVEISESMRVSLDGQRFAGMSPEERRTFLFDLTKCKASGAVVKARALAKGCDEAKIDAVLPLARAGGFPTMCDHAKSKATEAKGAWRALTGETYGAVKAPAWEAAKPDAPEDGASAVFAQRLADIDASIATMSENLGTIKAAARTADENATKRTALEASAKKVPDLADQLTRAQADLAEYEPKVVALRARAGGKARVGLVHDMAGFLETYLPSLASSNAAHDARGLLDRYEAEHGKLGDKVDTEAQAALPAQENGLTVIQNRVKNLIRDLDSAKQAKGQYDALAPAGEAVDASEAIAEVDALVKAAKVERVTVQNQALNVEAAIKNRAAADKKTADALAHHKAVESWTVVAAALAPDGIPAELLADALAPVNAALEQAALDTEWAQVRIHADMDITAGKRPYRLLSESEQWRTDAMIAQVVSELSGLKILMLDRMDVLDLPGRAQVLDWLDVLAANDLLDTALLFATLKAPPTGLAETIDVHWVENGAIAGAENRVAA